MYTEAYNSILDEHKAIDASFGTITGSELIPCDLCARQPSETETIFVMQKLFVDRCLEFFICKKCLHTGLALEEDMRIKEKIKKEREEDDGA